MSSDGKFLSATERRMAQLKKDNPGTFDNIRLKKDSDSKANSDTDSNTFGDNDKKR